MYFKPYYHERTRKTYIDGALRRNNPIRVADEERKLIWPDDRVRPDVILSLGTGIQVGLSRLRDRLVPSSNRERVKDLIPEGLRKNILAAYDIIASTLNCEKEWEDFVHAHRSDPQFVDICHRLNVGLLEKPPKLDDVSKIDELEEKAMNYLGKPRSSTPAVPYINQRYRSAHDHIKVVANRLLATLFYFDDDDVGKEDSPPTISGVLRCRLSPSMRRQFASLLHSGPEFRVQDSSGRAQDFFRKPQFDKTTFSSPVKFYENTGVNGYWIEIRIKSRGADWQQISGF
jgi:hypothetical protein